MIVALCFAFFFELGDLNTFSYAAPGLTKYAGFGISEVSHITSAGFFGMFAGAAVGGWLSDRLGRRRALVYAIVWYSVFSLANALVPATEVPILLARVLTGMGLSAMTVTAITYLAEVFPADKRGRYQALTLGIGLLGIPVTSWVAKFVVPLGPEGWRFVFVFGALGILFLVLFRPLPESPRWLEDNGRHDEAAAAVERVAGMSGVEVQPGDLSVADEEGADDATQAGGRTGGLRNVWRAPYVRRTAMLWITWAFQTVGFYGFVAWVPELLLKHGFSLLESVTWAAVISLGNIPGAFIAYPISDRFGRKWSIVGVSVAIAVCGVLYGFAFNTATIAVFGFLVTLFIQAFAALLYAYTPEQYRTEIRNAGSGLAYGVGRLANVVGPLIIGAIFAGLGYLPVFVFIAICWLVCALTVGALGPRTERRSLEVVSEERRSAKP
ncbi:MFS transporter [Rubrobacter calidifluminis]|uniref:MFS transporter n=1 Tax=Rubrobacter calidifluminis TaxID=1392640 RepID=UPI002362CF33|nr:MFS transporter [Rubrobacter calidifluminis]